MRVFPLFNSITTGQPTNRLINGRTDKASYRVASLRLKTNSSSFSSRLSSSSLFSLRQRKLGAVGAFSKRTFKLGTRFFHRTLGRNLSFYRFLVADTQLYKRLCPSVRWSVGRSVRHARVDKWENAYFRPCPPVRN